MPLPAHLVKRDNDVGVLHIAPSSPTDPRVPEAAAYYFNELLEVVRNRSNPYWSSPLSIASGTNQRDLIISGSIDTGILESPINIQCTIEIPSLESNVSIVSREDFLSVILFCAEVGADHDAILGQAPFSYRVVGDTTIQQATKENTRRLRLFWLLSLSASPLTTSAFTNSLSTDAVGDRRISILSQDNAGFAIGSIRYYSKDTNLVLNKSYPVFTDAFASTIKIIPLGSVKRLQNFPTRGYTWGNGSEEKIDVNYNLLLASPPSKTQPSAQESLRRKMATLMAGKPGTGFALSRCVENLTAGTVAGNPGKAGEPAGSPNGSVCLSNGQRVTFTNQAWISSNFAQTVTALNDGNGNAVLALTLNANSPSGTTFSDRKENHKIYSFSGTEESLLGTFSNLGGSGSLVWYGSANSSIKPGSQAIFVPAISYPSGSGFSVPYSAVEKAWLNGQQISTSNILRGFSEDLNQYADPVNNESYIVISGQERSAIHYIYKKLSLVADGAGVLSIPSGELGCFAFIKSVAGRIDAPVYKGLLANTKYDALVYYTPRTLESWQFQLSYVSYQGVGQDNFDFINNSKIISTPLVFATSQGGGCSVYRGEGALQFVPVGMHLPSISTGIPIYTLDTPLQLQNEVYAGPVTNREMPLMPGSGLTFPTIGTTLTPQKETQIFEKSCSLTLNDSSGNLLGFYAPPLVSKRPYLIIIAFLIEKNNQRKMVVATKTTYGDESVALSILQNTAIDLFAI